MDTTAAIGQKLLMPFVGTQPSDGVLAAIQQQRISGVSLYRAENIASPEQLRKLVGALQEAARATNQPPLLVGLDQEGGQLNAVGVGATEFPGNLALGATGSAELAQRTGYALGRELAAMGVNVDYAPVCDVNSNPQNPVVGTRSFGENPQLVAQLAAAMINGLQAAGVAATAKHFPGHGDTASDSHDGLIVVPHARERLQQVELHPFKVAIDAGVQLVMTAHIALPALTGGVAAPATLAPQVLRGLLREELGFGGVIISDALDMGAIGQEPATRVIDTFAAVAAGVDLLLMPRGVEPQQQIYDGLVQAARRGLLDADDLARSVARVLALRQWVAQQPQPSLDVVGAAEHRALAFETAARAITLVRDDAGLLPLRLPADARLAVVVPQSVNLTPADTSSSVQCELAQAVRRYHPRGDEIIVTADQSEADIAALRQRLATYDLVIIGTTSATTLPGQAALVNALLDSGVPTIAVALRMPYDLAMYARAPTYLCAYSILPPAMEALAGVLWGRFPLAGRLPVSIPELYPLGHGLTTMTR